MKRNAFTLVELLVVITIIGMLMALTIPAINAVRETARRAQCSTNLRNLAQAILQGETNNRRLPSGGWGNEYVGDADRGYGSKQPGSWGFVILPWLEQEALYGLAKNWNPDPDSLSNEKRDGAAKTCRTELKVFYCPSRRPARSYPLRVGLSKNVSLNAGELVGKSDYAANSGANNNVSTAGPGDFNEGKNWDNNLWPRDRLAAQNGLIYHHSSVQVGQVPDGMGNTYLVGEKYLHPDRYENGNDEGDKRCLYAGYAADNQRCCYYDGNTSKRPMQDHPKLDVSDIFGSAHAGNLRMAMGDSAIRAIPYIIDPQVHAYLGQRDDMKNPEIPGEN